MAEQFDLQTIENLGYYLLPKSHPHSPGYPGLFVILRERPSESHFDPESMHLRLREQDFPQLNPALTAKRARDVHANWITLRLNSPISDTRHVCPGEVTLTDRRGKRVQFFTFGGSLTVIAVPHRRIYALRSPAPILELQGDAESVPDQLAAEVEALLARFEARWQTRRAGFIRRLASLDPFQFYAACLEDILARLERSPALRRSWPGFHGALQEEQQWLAQSGQWPDPLPALEDLLAPHGPGGQSE